MELNRTTPTDWSQEITVDGTTKSNPQRHGTKVAGVIAAEFNSTGTVGVAFKSTILGYQTDKNGTCPTTDGCSLTESNINRAIDNAIADGAKIINLSLGSGEDKSGSGFEAALLRATNAGIIVVVASGNESLSVPGWPAQFANDARFQGRIVIAGSIAQDFTTAASSNKAGLNHMNYYISAPGVSIITDCASGSCWQVGGTSFAAPHVSGALALILQAFPNLSVAQAIDIMYKSATDLGTNGVDGTFGWGALNLDKAFSPLGAITSSTSSDEKISINEFNAISGPAFGDAFNNANLVTGVIDSYGRSFNVNLSNKFAAQKVPLFGTVSMNGLNQKSVETVGTKISYVPQIEPIQSLHNLGAMNSTSIKNFSAQKSLGKINDDVTVKIAYANEANLPNSLMQEFTNEFGGFGIQSLHTSQNTIALGFESEKFTLNLISSKGGNRQYGTLNKSDTMMSAIELGLKLRLMRLNFEAGTLNENGALWGLRFNEGLGQIAAKTGYYGFSTAFSPISNIVISSRAQFSQTNNTEFGSAFTTTKPARASSFGLELKSIEPNGAWRFGLEQPMRIYDGAFAFNLADAFIDWAAPATHSHREFSIVPSGREMRINFARDFYHNDGAHITIGAGQIRENGHVKQAEPINHIFISGATIF